MKLTAIFSANGKDVLRATIQTKIISGHPVPIVWEGDPSAILVALPARTELPTGISPAAFETGLSYAASLANLTVRFEKVGRAICMDE